MEEKGLIYERFILLILLSQMNNVPILPETTSYGWLSVGYPNQACTEQWQDSTSVCLQYAELYSERNLEIVTLKEFQST